MFPLFHCFSVKPDLMSGCEMAYDSARCFRGSAVKRNSFATRHAAFGNGMFGCAFGAAAIGGPVGEVFSVLAVLPNCVRRMAIAPAIRTTAPITISHLLKRRDEIAELTTFTAIRIVDDESRCELGEACRKRGQRLGQGSLENGRLGPRAPDAAQRIAHLAERDVGLGSLDE